MQNRIYLRPKLYDLSQGSRIKFIRIFRHLTQDNISEDLGITGENKRRTLTRYDGNTNKCSRYMEFSSKILMVQIKDNKISLLSTLIDIYKDINIEKAIDISINNRDYNHFDLLFPHKSAKGKGKSEPMVLYISNDIYFDYVISGTKLIDEVLKIIELINQEFLTEFSKYYSDKDELYMIKTRYGKMDDAYTINNVFQK